MPFPYDADDQAAIDRLEAVSNSSFASGSHRTNFSPRLNDVATVANAMADAAEAAENYAGRMSSVSTSSVAIGTGSKSFTISSETLFRDIGLWVRVQSDAAPNTNYMLGYITASTATSITIEVPSGCSFGSGTLADWTLLVTARPGDDGRSAGLAYLFSTNTANSDPTSGKVKLNNATPSSATAIYISETDNDGNGIAAIIATWDDLGSSSNRGTLIIRDPSTPTNFAVYTISGSLTDNGAWVTLTATYVAGGGTLSNGLAVQVDFLPAGVAGATGATGRAAGLPMIWSTNTSESDPTTGYLKINNATSALATRLYISETDTDGKGITALINAACASTSSIRGRIDIFDAATPANWLSLNVTAALDDQGGWDILTITKRDGGGTLANGTAVLVHAIATGDKGDTGATGAAGGTGDTGATGPTTEVEFDWSASTTDADPGNGVIRADNGTYGSITKLYVDDLNRDGANVESWIGTWDDSTNTAHRGELTLKAVDDPDTWLKVYVSGANVDGTGYWKITVTYVGHSGTLSGRVSLSFARTGNKGSDGAGAGNVNYESSTPTEGNFVVAGGSADTIKDGGAFTAATIPFSATGGISSTNTQAAIAELDTEKAPKASPSFTGTVEVSQALTLIGDISPSQITSNQNDYAPSGFSTAAVLRLDLDAARTITGLAGGADGRVIAIINISSFNLTLADESNSSSASNRFALKADCVIPPDGAVVLLYDSTSSRWRALKSTSAAEVVFTAAGNLSATTVQAAIEELDTEKIPTSYLDTDTALAADSDTKIATQRAVKSYIDALLLANDAMVLMGAIDCSANPNYPAAEAGYVYKISVAGKIGGGSGVDVQAGDTMYCITDSSAGGTHASVGSDWVIVQNNIVDAYFAGGTDVAIADGGTGASDAATAFANLKQAASDSATGVVELATDAETQTGTDTARAITPANLTARTATTTRTGIAELATTTEVLTGTDADRIVTPDALAALWEKGSDVASAGTISLGEGMFFHVTGTTGITDIDFATPKDGRIAFLEFDGVVTITHHATTLVCPQSVDIVTAAGDVVCVVQDSSDNIHVLFHGRKAGTGYINIPQNSQSAAYTLVLADAGKHIFHPSADTTARIWTIPANSSVAYPVGTAITFINQNGAGVITIAITSDTMRLAGAGTTGSRTLAANGVATAIKVTSTEWIISGTGLT